jgi:type IV pilus assembly protein PilN
MAHINLLPWREERRQVRKREFFALLAAVVIGSALTVFGAMMFFDQQIDLQNARLQFLDAEIAELDTKIAKIKELEKRKADLLQRQKIIEDLQSQRHVMVHLFDELVTTIPEGTFLTNMKQTGQRVELSGRAQSNARVSQFMRSLENSPWMKQADLIKVETKVDSPAATQPRSIAEAGARNEFQLAVTIENPNAPKTEQDASTSGSPPPPGSAAAPPPGAPQ